MNSRENNTLSSLEEIELHTLSVRDYWSSQAGAAVDFNLTEPERARLANLQGRSNPDGRPKRRRTKPSSATAELPETWNLIGGKQLFAWQEDCMAKWFNRNGTVKVVTGAGKTVLALAIIERLHIINPELRVAIVVPTIVLMDQWFDEITNGSNLPSQAVGRMGGGHKQGFSKDTRILICVLKSAADKLAANVDESGVGENLLLIVDECHRAGSKEMSKVFRTRRAYNLGLSATPEREVYDDGEDDPLLDIGYDTSMLGKELGPIIYEMTLAEADSMGLLPEFEVRHYGLPLLLEEREQYEKLSAEINKLQDELRDLHDTGGASFFAVCQKLAQQEGPLAARAMRFIKLTSDRKRLLYGATHRSAAGLKLAEQALKANRESRVIIFHESIDDVMRLYVLLTMPEINGRPVFAVVEHSGLPRNLRAKSIDLFRRGIANVMVSARSLVEGFNVPRADVGIIAASNTSIRQRVQTLGRVLRRPIDGQEKKSEVHVLYCADTTDEGIYRKADWGALTGAERNSYFLWDPDGDLVLQPGPPASPLPKETDVDPDTLVAGNTYHGGYTGQEFTCRSDGNVYSLEGKMAANPQGVPDAVRRYKGSYGRFKITPMHSFILVLVPTTDDQGEQDWQIVYAGALVEKFTFDTGTEVGLSKPLSMGDEYPRKMGEASGQKIVFRQMSGRYALVKSMGRDGSVIARGSERSVDKAKGREHDRLVDDILTLSAQGYAIREVIYLDNRDVVFADKGAYRYIKTLQEGLEFPG